MYFPFEKVNKNILWKRAHAHVFPGRLSVYFLQRGIDSHKFKIGLWYTDTMTDHNLVYCK